MTWWITFCKRIWLLINNAFMINTTYPFLYKKILKFPKIAPDARFYIADSTNSDSSLFVARTQYYDTLIQKLPEGFISIYRTEFLERIYSASAHDSQRWYLVTLLRFGDGIDPRLSYRSIFIAAHSNSPTIQQLNLSSALIPDDDEDSSLISSYDIVSDTESNHEQEKIFPNTLVYPVSTRTFYPQYIAWNNVTSTNYCFFTSFMNTIQVLEIVFHVNTYKIIPRKMISGFTFRSFPDPNNSRTFVIDSNQHKQTPTSKTSKERKLQCDSPIFIDRRENDMFLSKFKLPVDLEISPQTEFRVFASHARQKINDVYFPTKSDENRISIIRCILFSNSSSITIVFPYSKLSTTFFRKNENNSHNQESSIFKAMNSHNKPASKLPFSMFLNEFILIAAPSDHITIMLIDQLDRLRASFKIELSSGIDLNSCKIDLSNIFSMNYKGSLALSELTGDICRIEINPLYFVSKDVRFVIPILHYLFNTSNTQICIQLMSNDLIEFLWNGEFFNELLLLVFNEETANKVFKETVCSTFCKEKHYYEWNQHFSKYSTQQTNSKRQTDQNNKRHNSLSIQTLTNDSLTSSNDSVLVQNNHDTNLIYESLPFINKVIKDDSTSDMLSDTISQNSNENIPKSPSTVSLSSADNVPVKKKKQLPLPLPSTKKRPSFPHKNAMNSSIYRSAGNVKAGMLSPQRSVKIDSYPSIIHSFSEIKEKAEMSTLKALKCNNFIEFYDSLLELMTGDLFDVKSYPQQIQFPVYLQLLSLKFLFCRQPISEFVVIDETFFNNNPSLSKSIKEFWSAHNFLNWATNWPKLDYSLQVDYTKSSHKDNNQILRTWWTMKASQTVIMEEIITTPETNFFQVVEKLVTNNKMGKEIHELHLTLFGQDLYQCAPSV